MKWLSCGLLLLSLSSLSWAAPSGDPICASKTTLLRKGPGGQFPASWKAAKYMPFLRFESKNGWVKVQDLEGETHWAQGKDLSKAIRCVVVKSTLANLRRDPAGKAAELKTLDRYTPLKRLDNEGEWMHVEDEAGHQAWINEANVWKPARISSVSF